MNIEEAMKLATPGPWWDESGTAHAKGPEWCEADHSCVHPIRCGNGTEYDSALACHWYNHGPKLLAALKVWGLGPALIKSASEVEGI